MTTITATLTRAQIEQLPHYRRKNKKRGEYSSACPFCGQADRDGFLFWPEVGNYWCRKCGTRGFIDAAPLQVMDPEQLAARKRTEAQRQADEAADVAEKVKALPSRAAYYHSLVDQARAYYHAEGITDDSIAKYQLGYAHKCPTAAGPSYVIPYTEAGQVVSIRHRLASEDKGRYRPEFAGLGNHLFNVDALTAASRLNVEHEAVLVEGEKKAIVLNQVGFRAAAYPGVNTWKPEWIKHFGQVDRVLIAADPGTREQAEQIAQQFRDAGKWAKVTELPAKPDDMIRAGTTPEELLELLRAGDDVVKPRVKSRLELRLQVLENMARRTELKGWQRPHYRPGAIPFEIADDNYQAEIVKLRSTYTSAKEWGDVVALRWPELDPAKEEQIKLGENIAARIEMCGRPFKRLSATGSFEKHTIDCGYCEKCQARDRENTRRALTEVAMASPDMALTNHIETDPEKKRKFIRRLRLADVAYLCSPTKDGEYHIVIQGALPELGEVLDPVDLTDDLLKRWLDPPTGKRPSGRLIESRRDLKARYRELAPYEAADPWQRDAAGRPIVDRQTKRRVPRDDVQKLTLPGLITDAIIPASVVIEHEVHDADQLQKAIFELHERAVKVLAKRGSVIYGVIAKEFFTPKMTLPELLAEFNANQAARRQYPARVKAKIKRRE